MPKFERTLGVVNAVAAVITALAAVAIPIVLSMDSLKTRTIDIMNSLDQQVSSILSEKSRLDSDRNTDSNIIFTPDYIDGKDNWAIQTQVYKLLNLYDYVCLGANRGLFDIDMIEEMRGDALRKTWQDYGVYIENHRKKGEAQSRAWVNCDSIIAKPTPTPEN
ncbi:DUF4760 domain-containing protein [Rhizobium leguminosarum]|uniref:DUF4760 domain-containing protein n=1 Tax=Rhizobium leguminosarum TaxID=384 RepID=UPI0004A42C38|nr:DUF4760 domain-containing protein [Rhizobium leguminosarum]